MHHEGTIGFLGYGNMASAIAEGMVAQGTVHANAIAIYDPVEARMEAARDLGAKTTESEAALAKRSAVLVLAVKPQQMETALAAIKPGLAEKTLIISIAAGISTGFIRARLGAATRVIRVMPNTPALVEQGATGMAPGEGCTEADLDAARALFEAIGIAEVVTEEAIDTVTALSGSGPAYFFYVVECLIAAAEAEGLDGDVAARLAGQTLLGAGTLLQSTGETAEALRNKVTSPGGTTEAAINAFQEHDLKTVLQAGVKAAAARSRELGG